MSPPDRLAKMFPFYLMDINGFGERISQARKLYGASKDIEFLNVANVSLQDLQEVFKTHASWKDLNDEESEFVCFLRDACPPDLSMESPEFLENRSTSMNISVAESMQTDMP